MPSSRRGISLPDVIQQLSSWGFLHLDVSEEFLAGILQTGPKKIHHIVDYQETVVIALTIIDGDRWILLVVSLNVELLLLGELPSIDGG